MVKQRLSTAINENHMCDLGLKDLLFEDCTIESGNRLSF